MKPSDEQIKEFWEYFGFQYRLATEQRLVTHKLGRTQEHTTKQYKDVVKWLFPDGMELSSLPPIDLDNLWKYAVPKLVESGYTCGVGSDSNGSSAFCWAMLDRVVQTSPNYKYHKDPALALFWAICFAHGIGISIGWWRR